MYKRAEFPPHTDISMVITLNAGKWEDAELFASCIRDSVLGSLTVKDFNEMEAVDVLRLLWARQINNSSSKENKDV